MRFFVGVTDGSWFAFLRSRPHLTEINFWQPSPRGFRAIDPGYPFLFKLKSPVNAIAGGAFLQDARVLPLSLAWDAFGEGNGVADLGSLRRSIGRYRGGVRLTDEIGCVMLRDPFYFAEPDYIPAPEDWHPNIVTGKTYSTTEAVGQGLWKQVQLRTLARAIEPSQVGEEAPMYGEPTLVRPRLGQAGFRVAVTETYERRCAVTGERVLPVLDAAHILPVAEGGVHRVDNGLLLRKDVHRLFDLGYATVTPDRHEFRVSSRLQDEFDNGEHYRQFEGETIWMPPRVEDRPRDDWLEWHGDVVFQP